MLLMYRNEPSVIMGRNQNPWKEVNFKYLNQNKIHLLRRESGGGCVYHDLGNTNFSFFTKSHKPFNNLKIIQEALLNVGLQIDTSPRHELLIQGKKVSTTDNNYLLYF
eukprot:TRINITY_DN3517_c0_g1_i4.p1 TRINITY_DN3517_c0_g1~~TRINITY_DN3517_c0_g1_i4.p1  ORF type:complete len:108 (-),score=7.60 TRINITY_DN3517_c0_g1_i4:25-348(-)